MLEWMYNKKSCNNVSTKKKTFRRMEMIYFMMYMALAYADKMQRP